MGAPNQYSFTLVLAQTGSNRVTGATGFRSIKGERGASLAASSAELESVSTDQDGEVVPAARWHSVAPGMDEEADEVMVFRGTGEHDFAFFVDVFPQVGGMLGRAFIPRQIMSRALDGQVRVPVVSANMMPVGMLAMRYHIVKPWEAPSDVAIPVQPRPYWATTRVWGHRGSGSDKSAAPVGPVGASFRRTHVAENTLLSFVTAASLGAEYVEFDVQLASDGVPVIHHDYLVKLPGGLKLPLSHISSAQLRRLSATEGAGAAAARKGKAKGEVEVPSGLHRSSSTSSVHRAASGVSAGSGVDSDSSDAASGGAGGGTGDADAEAKRAGSKKAARSLAALGLDRSRHDELQQLAARAGSSLSDAYTTLAEVFDRVPVSCGFNIEVKYPSDEKMVEERLTWRSRNALVDATLDVVFRKAGARSIMFSSFDPDICVLLMRKQGVFPVFFLTEAGEERVNDPRRNSLRAAARFAKSIGCLGVVSHAGPLCAAPRLISAVQESGLLLCTYGDDNNNAAMVRLQKKHGVNVVIVDHVAHISKALREGDGTSPIKPTPATHPRTPV